MKNLQRYMRNLIAVLVAVAALSSCEHKDLCYHHPHTAKIKVEFDWSKAPLANPEGMSVYFYPVEGGEPRRFDFAGRDGGYVEITVGKYNVVVNNNDTEAVLFGSKSSFDALNYYTREGGILEPLYGRTDFSAPRPEGTEDEAVVISPDMMWAGSAMDIDITDSGTYYTHETITSSSPDPQVRVDNTTETVLTFIPEEIICTYTYEVRNVKNLKYIGQMCGALSGLAAEFVPSTMSLTRNRVTIPFEASSDGESKIVGEFYTFGQHAENTQPHMFILYLWQTDGQGYARFIDVSSQVDNAPDPKHVHIIIDTDLDLPKPIENGNGFQPSVDGWSVVEQDITM